jgi:uncharacterized protein (TIGR00369 family)
MFRGDLSLNLFEHRGNSTLPGKLGMQIEELRENYLRMSLILNESLLAPNGYLHGGTVVALADTVCGYATMAHLPVDALSFTTVELKCNFFATAREGTIFAEATPVHLGRNTQVWDAKVLDQKNNKTLALFRCTNLMLWPKTAT